MQASIIGVLQEKGALRADQQPLQPREIDLRGGVPIIDIPRKRGSEQYDFIVYDNVTSPDGVTLIQNKGTQYTISVSGDQLTIEDKRTTEDLLLFGLIGTYPDDYYLSSRAFTDGLKTRYSLDWLDIS